MIIPSEVSSDLLEHDIIFLSGSITQESAEAVISQLLYLDRSDDTPHHIDLYINSDGGDVTSGFSIYDMMQQVKRPVYTYCLGEACSMAALILAGGTPGKRFSMPNSSIMIHQISSQDEGKASELLVSHKETVRLQKIMVELLSYHTGRTTRKIKRDTINDLWLSPKKALEYGLIDHII